MRFPRYLAKVECLLTLLALVGWGAPTARADEVPDLKRVLVQLHDMHKQQGEINDQLKKVRADLADEIIRDVPADKKVMEMRAAIKAELAGKEEQLTRRFDEARKHLLVWAQRLEKSDGDLDRKKANVLRNALNFCEEKALVTQFTKLVTSFKTESFEKLQAVQQIQTNGTALSKDLQALLDVLPK